MSISSITKTFRRVLRFLKGSGEGGRNISKTSLQCQGLSTFKKNKKSQGFLGINYIGYQKEVLKLQISKFFEPRWNDLLRIF